MTNLRDLCPTIYGPVQSRRHGLSLGINLGDPQSKICTWGCIYCQCGFGSRSDAQGLLQQGAIPTADQVLKELEEVVRNNPALDSVTMAGNSEPTAHPQFPEIVARVLDLRARLGLKWIFNCLSNGSELGKDSVVKACDSLDEIWVKMDCAVDSLFKKLNRPVNAVGGVEDQIARIKKLRAPGIQSLLWTCPEKPEIANWTEENREALREAYRKIRPAQIFITTVKRQPAFTGLQPVDLASLEAFGEEVRRDSLNKIDVKVFV